MITTILTVVVIHIVIRVRGRSAFWVRVRLGLTEFLLACVDAQFDADEIEVDRLDQLSEVLDEGGADVVLLDNMDTQTLVKAVE